MNIYGRLSNATLVRMYGFAEHNNPNDTVSDCKLTVCYFIIVGMYSSNIDKGVVSRRSCSK